MYGLRGAEKLIILRFPMREQGAAGVSPVSVHESVTSRDEHYIAAVVTETIVEGTDKSLI